MIKIKNLQGKLKKLWILLFIFFIVGSISRVIIKITTPTEPIINKNLPIINKTEPIIDKKPSIPDSLNDVMIGRFLFFGFFNKTKKAVIEFNDGWLIHS